jgi:hypothetical protein
MLEGIYENKSEELSHSSMLRLGFSIVGGLLGFGE